LTLRKLVKTLTIMHDNMVVEPYGSRTLDRSRFGVKRFMGGGSFPEFFVSQQPHGTGFLSKRLPREDTTQPLKRKERFSLEPDSISADLALENNTRPGHKSVEASKERTIKGIELRLGSGQNLAVSKKDLRNNEPSYVKYSAFRSEGSAKIIRMQEVSIDPLEPSKFRHKKVPKSSGTAIPETVHHSPEREKSSSVPEEWIIPASISNWKNPKGYTIPLDKRLAADGRNLNSLQINDKFANLSEALYLAEHKARQAVEIRANIQKELLVKQKEKMESDLRNLARIAKKEKEK